jgi:hypothetical protein
MRLLHVQLICFYSIVLSSSEMNAKYPNTRLITVNCVTAENVSE